MVLRRRNVALPGLELDPCIASMRKSPLRMFLKEQNNLKIYHKASIIDYFQGANISSMGSLNGSCNLQSDNSLLIPREIEKYNATEKMLEIVKKRKKLRDEARLIRLSNSRVQEEKKQAKYMNSRKIKEQIQQDLANSKWSLLESAMLRAKAKKERSIERARSAIRNRYSAKWEKVAEQRKRAEFEFHRKIIQAENRVKKIEERYLELMHVKEEAEKDLNRVKKDYIIKKHKLMEFIQSVASPRKIISLESSNRIKELLARPVSFIRSATPEMLPFKSSRPQRRNSNANLLKKRVRSRIRQHKSHGHYSSSKLFLPKRIISDTLKIYVPKQEDYKVLYNIPHKVIRNLLQRHKKLANIH
eukprot:TRINITY_DN3927_c0_g1_i19.p1 TRINITY_DN3927_c0_g1~~TRINITY_DN3927_c0_g1_i19.p1  ORF type:complete len:359 (-),score=66.91 TRINITY_DN3927_c0_g1_i19:165-1241(-)